MLDIGITASLLPFQIYTHVFAERLMEKASDEHDVMFFFFLFIFHGTFSCPFGSRSRGVGRAGSGVPCLFPICSNAQDTYLVFE